MEYIKKNYMKLILAVLVFVAAIFFALVMFGAMDLAKAIADGTPKMVKNAQTGSILITLGVVIALLGVVAAIVLKTLGMNKIAAIVLTAVGAVTAILIIIGFILSGKYLNEQVKALPKKGDPLMPGYPAYGAYTAVQARAAATQVYGPVFTNVAYLLVFGLTPVVYGLKGLLTKKEA